MPNSLLEQYRRGLAAQGVTDDRDDFFVMRDTLGVWAQEDPALLAQFPDFAEEWRAVREADSPGTLGGIKNTGKKAFLQSRQGMQAIGGLDRTDTEDVSQLESRIREIPSSVPWDDWQRTEGKEAVKVFLRDPIEIVSNIVTAGLTGSVPALAGGLAGGLGGAAAGSALGPAGSALAGTAGAAAGTFAGSLAVEYGGKYLDVLREEGADLADPESIQRVLEDPETRARARSLAFRRGVPVAAFDAASAGLAGKFFKGMKGATTGQIVRRGSAEALVQGGLGGGGEVAGALSAGEEIKPGSVFEEIIGEMGPAAVEIGGAAARRSIAGSTGTPVTPPIIPPPVVPSAAGPVAPIIPTPVAPVAPVAPTNAQVAIAVERLTDEEAAARLADLQALPSRTPDLDLEIELLLARVPEKTAVVPVAAPIVTPSAAVGTPVVEPTPDIVVPPVPTAAVAPRLSLDEDYTQPAEQIPTVPPPLALDERYGGAPEPRFDNAGGAVLAAVESARATQAEFLGENGLTIEQARLLPPEQQAELQQRFTAWVAAKEAPDVQPAAAPEAAPEAQKPVAPAAPTPVPPKVAAPAVAAQPDLPKPTAIAPAVPSAAPTPEEHAAVAAVVVPQPKPLPYGQLLPAGPVENFRTFKPTKPLAWEAGVVNLMKPVKGSPLPQVELGDKGGAKGVTKTGLALLMPDGVGVVLAGIVTPQSILRVAGGNDKLGKPALQRMGVGTKGKRSIEVGGELPVLLREVAEAGYKPLGIYRFTGEPAVIFQQFANLAAFDAAVAATARFENAAPGVVPVANVADADLPVGRITGLKRIEAEIDRLSPLLIEAIERKDAAAEATLLARYTELEKRQKAAIVVNQTAARNQPLNPDSPEVQQAIRDLNNDPGVDSARGSSFGPKPRVDPTAPIGVPGIKYLDGGSRAAGTGTRNFVVFDGKSARILEANGVAHQRPTPTLRTGRPAPPRTDPSRIAVEATRAQQFGQVMSRLRAQGAKVDVLTTEFFRLGVRREIESQIAQLQQRAAGAVGPQKRAIERDIAHRQARLSEVDEARGATFGPWQIALAVDDIQNASMGNLITLIHEAVESLSLTMDSVTKGKIGLAIQASITDLRDARDAASERTGVEVASERGGPFDLLSETLAQKLAAEGIVDPSIAQAVWRWIKDLYYRAAMTIQAAFGAEPSHEMALDWFENQLERVIGGDYDYRIGNLIARFLPEQTSERISRFEQPAGTPGAMTDFFDPFEQRLQQPGVLPNTSEAIGWNVQFQTGPAQVVGGLAIPNPEARARENAAGIRKFIEELDAIRAANGVTTPWEEWWGQFATSGTDPRVMLAELEQRDRSLATAAIGGERMTDVMNGLAALNHRKLMENFQASSLGRAAAATEQIDAEADSVIEASREVNRLEKDRRNSDLQEGALQKRLKGLVRQFTRDNSAGYRAAEQQGALAEAVREAENLIDGDPIPEQYQQVFKSVLDGKTPVFDYIRAIAELELDLSSMTQAEVVKAIRDSADSNPALGRLAQNRPLLTALAVLARKNNGIVDEIHLGWLTNAEDYRKIHDELQEIREATDEQLKQMLATMDERVKAVGPRERLKKDYLARRRTLREARDRLARAQLRADTITQVLPDVALAVERAQQQGSEAPSEWSPVEGAIFTEMVPTAAGWTKRTRELRTRNDGSFEDSDAIQRGVANNLRWLKEKASKKGGKAWEDVNRQTMQMRAIDASAQYATAQGRKMDRFLAPMMSEARNLGGLGPQVAQALAFFEHIRFTNRQQVETNAHEFSKAWKDVQRATGIKDNGLLQKQIYDPISYFLNTEPGLDEQAAIRQALRMARARLAVPPSDAFNASVERLLRASKAGFETLVRIATENGAFVRDTKLKSELRNAVARGWLTSMRSLDGGLVQRLTRDMEKSGWKLAREWVDDPRGGGRPKKLKKVKAVTFRDFEAEDMADSDAVVGVLNRLFPAPILRDWLMPFINKGGVEVFRRGKTEIPQSVIQDAWAQAGQGTTNNGERILRWLDLVDAATASEEYAGETQAVGDEDGDVLDEGDGMPGEKDVGRFRLNMLRQIDALFGMESKMAFDASQTRDMFDPFGPKPHVVMDARMNDHIPQEHVNFALLDVQTSGMLLAEIAFHSAFGRNGARMVALLAEMRKKADAAKVDYEGLQQTTDAGRDAEAIALGWRDPKELKRLAAAADDIQQFQDKLEGFMGVGHAGGPFDTTSRVWMTLLNFLSGQIVDNPKTAFYNILNLAQTPFAQRSLGPETIRTVSDAFVTTAKNGVGSLLEAMHLNLMHASAEELELGQTIGQVRNLPFSVALADLGPGGRQGWKETVFIKPLQAIRFAQNKGVGLPLQGQAKDFPRLAVIPGLGVSNFVSQVAARGGMMAQTRQLERLLARGAKYFATHRTDATDPAFRFKAKDLGMGRWDQGVFDWWRVKAVENNMGTIEDMVRGAMPPMAKGERVITKDQLLKTAGAVATEVNGDSSVNTMPGILVSHPFLRSFFPLLRWPFWAMHKTNEGLATQAGKRNFKSYAKGVGILAMWNLPIGLAFTFLLDEYDEEVTGKKSNLPPLGAVAALPFLGPAAELLAADRSVPDTLTAYLVRGARAGNLGGIAADFVGQIANPSDPSSGRRVISLDQRVLVMSQLLNLQQATSNVIHQDWTTTWASFWSPLFRSVGGNAALHALDIVNNVVGLDNAESRLVMRTNAGNWLRAAAGELDIELRPGGSGTPTPMSVHTREMSTAAMAGDRIGFMESYRRALEAARRNVASDPSVPAMDREREAERRVLGGWRGRNPLGIFARPPTEIEVRRMLNVMDETGAQAVRDALNRYTQFTRLIAPSPEQSQARAAERRLMRPPTLPNPFRRQLAPTY